MTGQGIAILPGQRYIENDILLDGAEAREKRVCRWCRKPVEGRRRVWHPECVDAYLIRHDGSYARSKVEERDHGVCARCGLDCNGIRDRFERLDSYNHSAWFDRYHCHAVPTKMKVRLRAVRDRRLESVMKVLAARYPWVEFRNFRYGAYSPARSLWEMDHIKPVVEGGGGCGLDNLQTLCIPCHRAETAALAARRAQERREQKMPLLFQVAS